MFVQREQDKNNIRVTRRCVFNNNKERSWESCGTTLCKDDHMETLGDLFNKLTMLKNKQEQKTQLETTGEQLV